MSLKKRIVGAAAAICMTLAVVGVSLSGMTISQEMEESIFARNRKETLYFWYTDEALTDYLNSAAVAYGEQNDVRIIPVLVSGLEYLEQINTASLQAENMPDLYIVGNDSLEKANLGGLTSVVEDSRWNVIKEGYPDAARLAVTYNTNVTAYPFYFETSSLLYNRTYLEEFAKNQIQAEQDQAMAEEATKQLEEEGPQEEVEAVPQEASVEADPDIQSKIDERIKEILPETIDDILQFANEYDAPEQVEAVFKWDVTDIFYNYFFVGNYLNVGGAAGDNAKNMNIYNKDAISCLKVYQDLNQFFSIDTKEISYDGVLEDFIKGKIVYTVATTDAVAKLEEAKQNGEFNYEYAIAMVPDINDQLPTRSLSVTSCVVVNGYSQNKEIAHDFARYLTCENNDALYSRTGKVAARYDVDYGNNNLQEYVNEYEVSIPMPKMIETSNFWVELEIAFSQIWDGADVNTRLRQLSEKIMTQITGAPYTEEIIEDTPVEQEEVEYLDEEALRQEAQQESQEDDAEQEN